MVNSGHEPATGSSLRAMVARGFYPGDCRRQLETLIADLQPPDDLPHPLHGAVLPHAGWMYSGRVAARTLDCFREPPGPETVIMFGAVHDPSVTMHTLYPEGAWDTPLGPVSVDKIGGAAILKNAGGQLEASVEAHTFEHSIEVLVPMVKYFFPHAAIVPIAVLPEPSATAIGIAAANAMIALKRSAIFLASSDLTHYGRQFGMAPAGTGAKAQAWLEANDQRLIDLLCHGTDEEVLTEALAHRNACGAGALVALKGAMAVLGVPEGHLIEYTTSHRVMQDRVFQQAVGYAGVVF